MIRLTIDGTRVVTADGSTVLEAALAAGIEIPTLCHRPGCAPLTSCMVCLVRVDGAARMVPSCATRAREGMRVESETEDVRRARKTALELLLSDHAGDCLAPCQLVCPAHMRIDDMLRHIAAGEFRKALEVVKQHIPLPATLGRICPDLCEKGCRRGPQDGALAICKLKRFVADHDLASASPYLPAKALPTGRRVGIVGAGPAGLSAAYYLLLAGHDVTVYDVHDCPGGALRYAIDEKLLPRDVLDAEVDILSRLGMRFVGNTPLQATQRSATAVTLEELRDTFHAVLLALGPIEHSFAAALGLASTGKGIHVDPVTHETAVRGVFATGASVSPYRLAVRAVGDGHSAADAISAALANVSPHARKESLYSVRLHVLTPAELTSMISHANGDARSPIPAEGFTPEQAVQEARRCIHCGCEGVDDCDLRRHAVAYHANPQHFRGQRRAVERSTTAGAHVVFEPGKCISCGRCVQITAGDSTGQAYLGRGFEMRIGPSFDATFAQAVSQHADEVVAACPTAAIRYGKPS